MNWRGKAFAGVLALVLGMSAKAQEAVEFQGSVTYLLVPDSTLFAGMLQAFPQSMRLTFSGDDVKTEFFYGQKVGSELIYLAKDKRAYAFAPEAKSGISLTERDNWALAGELKKSELKEEENGTPCVSLLGLLVLGNGMQIESVGCTDPAWHLPAKANYRTGNQVLNGLPEGIVHMPIGVDILQKLTDGSSYRIHVERSTVEPGTPEALALPEGVSFSPVQIPGPLKRK
jgi:hypothetical protein